MPQGLSVWLVSVSGDAEGEKIIVRLVSVQLNVSSTWLKPSASRVPSQPSVWICWRAWPFERSAVDCCVRSAKRSRVLFAEGDGEMRKSAKEGEEGMIAVASS